MEAGGEASQATATGAKSAGEPKEHDVLSARPSPSELGLASESGGGERGGGDKHYYETAGILIPHAGKLAQTNSKLEITCRLQFGAKTSQPLGLWSDLKIHGDSYLAFARSVEL